MDYILKRRGSGLVFGVVVVVVVVVVMT